MDLATVGALLVTILFGACAIAPFLFRRRKDSEPDWLHDWRDDDA